MIRNAPHIVEIHAFVDTRIVVPYLHINTRDIYEEQKRLASDMDHNGWQPYCCKKIRDRSIGEALISRIIIDPYAAT